MKKKPRRLALQSSLNRSISNLQNITVGLPFSTCFSAQFGAPSPVFNTVQLSGNLSSGRFTSNIFVALSQVCQIIRIITSYLTRSHSMNSLSRLPLLLAAFLKHPRQPPGFEYQMDDSEHMMKRACVGPSDEVSFSGSTSDIPKSRWCFRNNFVESATHPQQRTDNHESHDPDAKTVPERKPVPISISAALFFCLYLSFIFS